MAQEGIAKEKALGESGQMLSNPLLENNRVLVHKNKENRFLEEDRKEAVFSSFDGPLLRPTQCITRLNHLSLLGIPVFSPL